VGILETAGSGIFSSSEGILSSIFSSTYVKAQANTYIWIMVFLKRRQDERHPDRLLPSPAFLADELYDDELC